MVSNVVSFCPYCGLVFLWWFCVVGLVLVACPGLWGLCLVVLLVPVYGVCCLIGYLCLLCPYVGILSSLFLFRLMPFSSNLGEVLSVFRFFLGLLT